MNISTKILVCFTLGLLFVLGMKTYSYAAFPASFHPSVYLNNEKIDIYTANANGVTLVPFRPIFEKYNMNVSWDTKTKTVTAHREGIKIELTHNSYDAYINGNKFKLIQSPMYSEQDGIFYVPLRFISEALNGEVIWKKTSDAEANIFINFPDQE